jgi:biotin transport system substrate-specific component
VVQYAIIASRTLLGSFLLVSVPYLVKDVISVIGAYAVAVAVRKALRAGHILEDSKIAA